MARVNKGYTVKQYKLRLHERRTMDDRSTTLVNQWLDEYERAIATLTEGKGQNVAGAAKKHLKDMALDEANRKVPEVGEHVKVWRANKKTSDRWVPVTPGDAIAIAAIQRTGPIISKYFPMEDGRAINGKGNGDAAYRITSRGVAGTYQQLSMQYDYLPGDDFMATACGCTADGIGSARATAREAGFDYAYVAPPFGQKGTFRWWHVTARPKPPEPPKPTVSELKQAAADIAAEVAAKTLDDLLAKYGYK